jgi:hypothetical protein
VRTSLIVASILLGTCVGPAQAVTYQTQRLGDGTSFIVVSGEFEPGETAAGLVAAATAAGASFVTFDTPGGSVGSAMAHGRAIRALGLNTIQLRSRLCASACSLAFLGGVSRFAEPGSIGVHRSYLHPDDLDDAGQAVSAIQELTAHVIAYIREMGGEPDLLEIAYSYDATDMRYLSASEMERFRVTNMGSGGEQVAAAPTPYAPAPEVPRAKSLTVESATELVQSLLSSHTFVEEVAVARLQRSYAPTVMYFGRSVSLGEVVKDKRDYFRRWPERAYEVDPSSVDVSCAGAICTVTGLYTWAVRSYPRNKQAAGSAAFTYVIDTSRDAAVVGESSEVVDRFKLR